LPAHRQTNPPFYLVICRGSIAFSAHRILLRTGKTGRGSCPNRRKNTHHSEKTEQCDKLLQIVLKEVHEA
jgi:hypothetical protein